MNDNYETAQKTQDSKFEKNGGLKPSTLHLGHGGQNIESLRVSDETTFFCFFETRRTEGGLNPRSPTSQAGSFNYCTRAWPPWKEEIDG